jgi:WD40 repeat protein
MTVRSINFSPQGRFIISGRYDKSVRFGSFNRAQIFSIVGNDGVTDVGFDPNMRFFISAGYNRAGQQESLVFSGQG